jgi:tetratricopeptide (TPR) repeat protein
LLFLPFENLSDDQQNTYFADGIQDDILSSLAKVADLKVISRTSVRQYRAGRAICAKSAPREALLISWKGRSGVPVIVFASTRHRSTHGPTTIFGAIVLIAKLPIFVLQSDLAEQIATALQANISPREKASLQLHPTADLDAYDLYLRARDLFRWSGAGDPRENGEKALRLLGEALDRDPQFALAHALASRFHAELYWFGYDRSSDRLMRAKREAETALRIHPELGDARLALAYYHYYGGHEYDLARKQLAFAQEATPNDAEVWDGTAAVDRRQGRWPDAVANFEKAWQLDPRNCSVI